MNSEIQIIIGPMYSGKTTELFRRIKRYQYSKKSCVIVKYSFDNRYSEEFASTHNKEFMTAISTDKLEKIKDELDGYEVIGIDEGQFYSDLVEFCENIKNKIIIVCGLDGTYQQKSFGKILDLIPKSISVKKLLAVCSVCCGDAPFTKRITEETEVEIIGSLDKYIAVCGNCLNN